jgi:hypothetical protein
MIYCKDIISEPNPNTTATRSIIPQLAVDITAPLTAPEMDEYQIPDYQYPEHQHKDRILDQPVLGKKCNKHKEQKRPQHIATGIRSGCADWHEMCRHAHDNVDTVIADGAFCTKCIHKNQKCCNTSNKIDTCGSDRIWQDAIQANNNCCGMHHEPNDAVYIF